MPPAASAPHAAASTAHERASPGALLTGTAFAPPCVTTEALCVGSLVETLLTGGACAGGDFTGSVFGIGGAFFRDRCCNFDWRCLDRRYACLCSTPPSAEQFG